MKMYSLIASFLLLSVSGWAQIYTPNNTIQGSSNNNYLGIGTNTPDRPLTIKGINSGNELISFKNSSNQYKWHINLRGGFNLTETGVSDYRLFIKDGGNVGIGTNTPIAKLDVNGSLVIRGTDLVLGRDNSRPIGTRQAQRALVHDLDDKLIINYDGDFEGGAFFHGPKVIFQTNKVGIGTSNIPNEHTANNQLYRLYVRGGIKTEEVKVEMCTGSWCDYVFKEDYQLMPLAEVAQHIQETGHLHKIASASTIEKEGLELKSMTINQQEKIEEIFLHLIQLEQRVKDLETKNKQLKNALSNQK